MSLCQVLPAGENLRTDHRNQHDESYLMAFPEHF